MINVSGNLTTLVNGTGTQNALQDSAGRSAKQEEALQAAGRGDSVTLSAQAIALARNVPPAGEGSESGSDERREGPAAAADEGRRGGGIDIRA